MKLKKWRKRRNQRRRLRVLDHHLGLIKMDIEMLDRVLDDRTVLNSHWYDTWTEGCREGLAMAYDLLQSKIEDITIRAAFEDRPIRIRYRAGRTQTVKDDKLIYRRRSVCGRGEAHKGAAEEEK